jgi:DNA repair exonuclease SbcCD ATPase subunit
MLNETPTLAALRTQASRIVGSRDTLTRRLSETQKEIKRLQNEEELLNLVAHLFREMIDKEIVDGAKAVERLLTEGLRTVFDDQDLQAKAEVKVQRGKVSVNILTQQTHSNGTVTEGTSDLAFGGSVLTAQSILMRIIVMLRRGLRPLLLLDETFPALDPNYAANMASFLTKLCKKLKMDLLLVTHNPVIVDAAEHAYRIKKTNGTAKFEKIR